MRTTPTTCAGIWSCESATPRSNRLMGRGRPVAASRRPPPRGRAPSRAQHFHGGRVAARGGRAVHARR
jgi:hypothetical protein